MAAEHRLRLTQLPGFADDVYALPDQDARKMALHMLVLVRNGQIEGEALGEHVRTGDLSDCYKLLFDRRGGQKPRFRLVYRYTPDELRAVAVEAVAVGPRNDLEAYRTAAERLGRGAR